MKSIVIISLVCCASMSVFSQEHNNILGASFSFDYNKNESFLSGNSNVIISSNNSTSFLYGSFITKRLMLGGGIGLNTSKFLSDDGTNVFEEKALGFNIYPDVRYYIPLKKISLFFEGTIYFGYSEKSGELSRPITAFDNGIRLKSGLGIFIKKFYMEASISIIEFNRNRTTTPVNGSQERINEQTSFEMLDDFTNISIGLFYHFGTSKHQEPKE